MATSWRKSSRSGAGNDCVELAHGEKVGAVRDSKNPSAALAVNIAALVTWLRRR